ncbi:MAG: tRNA (guanosine(37)-N1)-methyltransferase TrmD, partial [Planctomycetota bacterium]
MRIDAVTLFPGIFKETLSASILRIAAEKSLARYYVHNLRDWATDNYKKVDDAPYGGGPGMILKVDTMVRCVRDVIAMEDAAPKILLTTPQ